MSLVCARPPSAPTGSPRAPRTRSGRARPRLPARAWCRRRDGLQGGGGSPRTGPPSPGLAPAAVGLLAAALRRRCRASPRRVPHLCARRGSGCGASCPPHRCGDGWGEAESGPCAPRVFRRSPHRRTRRTASRRRDRGDDRYPSRRGLQAHRAPVLRSRRPTCRGTPRQPPQLGLGPGDGGRASSSHGLRGLCARTLAAAWPHYTRRSRPRPASSRRSDGCAISAQ